MTRNERFRSVSGMLLTAVLMAIFLLLQSSPSLAQDGSGEVMRTADGQPDLQGVWTNNTIVPVERSDFFATQERRAADSAYE